MDALAADIDYDLHAGEENWGQRKERIIRILRDFNAVFLRGPPGTGKSRVAHEIAREMGYEPADVVGAAIKIAKIATGEIEDEKQDTTKELARQGGLKGGKARAANLSAEKRSEIAKKAALTRWKTKLSG
jgi:nucleoside-triphosphatase THEP1